MQTRALRERCVARERERERDTFALDSADRGVQLVAALSRDPHRRRIVLRHSALQPSSVSAAAAAAAAASRHSMCFFVRCPERGGGGGEEIYQGLTRRLRLLFWPDTEEDPRKKDRNESKRRRRLPPADRHMPARVSRSCQLHSAAHGTALHRQMALVTDSTTVPNPVSRFFSRCPGPDPCLSRLLRLLVREAWMPVFSEYPVFYARGRVATQIDLIVYDSRARETVALEIKTGYEDEYYGPIESDGRFVSPLGGVVNCPYHRHQLQLASSLFMLKQQTGIAISRGYIVRLFSKRRGVQLLPLQPWAMDEGTWNWLEKSFCASR